MRFCFVIDRGERACDDLGAGFFARLRQVPLLMAARQWMRARRALGVPSGFATFFIAASEPGLTRRFLSVPASKP